ncbi:hypothetical protein MADA3029_80021 [Vibrio nigripulchritudo MADA3029]|uniref:hypothetical protein n=1 Tax=Vibrio nigripulchritudo TaxID=28173 RepID=UPI0003B21816|nr:hypothetical protein [Vibrio nigripulchritudo]CCN37326.1 hypothetical protein VIBNIAM115_560027 [Vibrio nigripulchritudo AM115]CCN38911.1 hypothetical protein VIBNIFTn2_10043 [Vibrio nigripulchritudo FTn2]CCN45842.1 hypothetical protein VIBNIMADA3020_1130021 [Vibrio nigripulchritudo MADA3020]CCN52604.1 hypothetical protein VIBNIMADA3021_1290029 [Vibrio nigripulchritudo MADA3021]CCN61474.1 hypothetical protein MADA3029_80021 [Vibrio nigripulchritudo MADA3029]
MKLKDKARLARTPGHIVGVREGTFVWFYNESLFAWQQWVKRYPSLPTLRVSACKVKALNNAWMFTGVVPFKTLENAGLEFDKKGRVFIKFEADWRHWEDWKHKSKPKRTSTVKISD